MIYIDTNVIISYIDELDPNHNEAVKLVKDIKERKVVSKLTLLELTSVYSRAKLNEPLALAIYSIENIGAEMMNVNFDEVMREAFKLAPKLRLKTLDLLHIAICKTIKARAIVTFDKNIISKAAEISKISIKVITKFRKQILNI